MNGCIEGDWEGEYTYVGIKGNSVIDYIIVNERLINNIKNFRIGERVDSDHMPLELRIIEGKGSTEEEDKEEEDRRYSGEEEEKSIKKRICWDKEAKIKFKESTEIEGEEWDHLENEKNCGRL